MLLYDNLEDAKVKLVSTFCYHKGKAVMVREVLEDEGQSFILRLQGLNARNYTHTKLDDPAFNYMNFNLGYSNHKHAAAWWYRIPFKQYRQGLKHDQVKRRASNSGFYHEVEFGFNKPITDMMENIYPKYEECEKLLKDQNASIMAFHKDFACTWDHIHQDLIVEYKGTSIGSMTSPKNIKLLDDYAHLTEALREAVA